MEFGKEIFCWQTWKIWTNSTHQIFYPRRIKAKEVSIRQKDGEFILPLADGTATLSGRDYEFRESTLRRISTVKLACILEADGSTNHHEDHIARNGDNSLQHYNLVQNFIFMPQAMKILAAKAAVDKEWEKLEKISAWNLTKVRSKKEVIDETSAGATDHFASSVI